MSTMVASNRQDRSAASMNILVRRGVGLIIRNQAGEILLERRSDNGFWGLPGGRVEPGESLTETALREACEETGPTICITQLSGVYSEPENLIVRYPDNAVQLVDVVLNASIVSGELVCSHESLELHFFEITNLPPRAEIVPPAWLPLEKVAAGLSGRIH